MRRYPFVCKRSIRGCSAGFTLFELIVVVCVVAILATVLLNRVRFYQKMAEKTAVEQMAGTLQSALNLRFASLIVNERMAAAPDLLVQNPVSWLTQKPANYAGEYFGAAEDVQAGQWYFDLKNHTLVYLVLNHRDLKKEEALPRLQFRTKLVLGSEDFPGTDGSATGKAVEGVVLEQIVPYGWN